MPYSFTKGTAQQTFIGKLGLKSFISLCIDDKIQVLLGWQMEVFTACVDIASPSQEVEIHQALIGKVEAAFQTMPCAVILWFIAPYYAQRTSGWETLGYNNQDIEELAAPNWQEVARQFMTNKAAKSRTGVTCLAYSLIGSTNYPLSFNA